MTNMRKNHLCAFGFVLISFTSSFCTATTLPAAPSGIERLAMTYDSVALEKSMSSTWVLPQLYVIDVNTGASANIEALPADLRAFATEHRTPPNALKIKPAAGATLLDGLLEVSRHADGSPMQRTELRDKQFAIFQLWAEWCTGCLEEAKELGDVLKAHPMSQVAWVAVEADPTKGKAEVVHMGDPSKLRGPNGKPVKLDANGLPIVDADGELVEE